MIRPMMSFAVVMNGPVARAGSMSRFVKGEGNECAKQGCKYDYAEKAEAHSDAEAWVNV